MMDWMLEERRCRRSEETHVALRYQLEHARDQGGLEALVVADASGLPLATSGDLGLCQELAAVAPILHRAPFGMPKPALLVGLSIAIRPIVSNGQELFLASAGGGVARDALLSCSIRGVQRILTSN